MKKLDNYLIFYNMEIQDGKTSQVPHLMGNIYDDERNNGKQFCDGHLIATSQLISIVDNIAITKTGSTYLLLNPYFSFNKAITIVNGLD